MVDWENSSSDGLDEIYDLFKEEPLCIKHPWSLRRKCKICRDLNFDNYIINEEIKEKKCVLNHITYDEDCAYCYMLKYDNHRGKMLDWLECPVHKPYHKFSYEEKKDCNWCYLIRQPKCSNHPLIIKGHCDVCDKEKFKRNTYFKYDLCPKDKGRMKINCKACSKNLIHCPVHPEEVKDACEICYFEMCLEHNQRKEVCSRCATRKKLEKLNF